ncbi:Rha family transcriptional regulator [Acinetobacter sp. ANC 5502]
MNHFALTASVTQNLDWVSIINNQTLTTSLKVAEVFGKRHSHVLRTLENLECSSEFASAHFWAHEEIIQAGAVKRPSKYYQMSKDGFIFLVMGFTGTKAAQIKEQYITLFNLMAQKLLQQSQPVQPAQNINIYVMPEDYKKVMLQHINIQDFFQQNYQLSHHSLGEDVKQSLSQFWLTVKIMMGTVELNHTKTEHQLALHLRHVYRVASQLEKTLPPLPLMRKLLRYSFDPLFIKQEVIKSKLTQVSTRVFIFSCKKK